MRSYSDLPEDITFAILSRVPAKSVGLCRCVSNPWRALLSRPEFTKTHLDLSKTNPQQSLAIFSYYSQHGPLFYSAPLSNNAHHLFDEITLSLTNLTFACHPGDWDCVYGSCDGLLLVCDIRRDVFVVNPVTREIREVPVSPFDIDPSRDSYCLYGLGYDTVSDDYKIVTISYYRNSDMFVNVYSLKSGAWKEVESSAYDHADVGGNPGAFVDGCLHWLARRKTGYGSVIVAFDWVEEKFREVPCPSLIMSDGLLDNYCLVVLGGGLCMFESDMNEHVWVMKEYGVVESWTKFTVGDGYFKCFLSCQEQVVMRFVNGKYIMWNLERGTSREIIMNDNSDVLYVRGSFVESLVSPHGSNESERE